jgi:hypothetical protein
MPLQMQVPSAARLLRAWETGLGTAPARQALLMLAACCPDAPAGALAALPVGARNRLLIAAYLAMFRPVYDCVADCPRCGCLLEAELPLEQVTGAGQQVLTAPAATEAELVTAGRRIRYRLPTAGDLAAVVPGVPGRAAPEPPDPRENVAAALLRRCLLEVEGDQADLPGEDTRALAEALTAADPDAVLTVQLTCPACDTSSELVLDPVTFLWADVDEWARRLLGEVHELASGYGWAEDAILAMSPGRRGAYLSLLESDDGRGGPGGGGRR